MARKEKQVSHRRAFVPLLGALVALFIAGCGGTSHSASTSSGAMPGASSSNSTQQSAAGGASTAPASGIPQNDGGDHDADNNGGPSDGDGNI
jgi:hypothetical protein